MQDLEVAPNDRIRINWSSEPLYMAEIDQKVWEVEGIVGRGLASSRFADLVGTDPTLLIFLRHLG